MGWYDTSTDFYSVNSYYYLRSDRKRHQANASLTKLASGFAGQHSLKFGAEFERSFAKTEVGYPGGGYVLADQGAPYYVYLGGNYVLRLEQPLFVFCTGLMGDHSPADTGARASARSPSRFARELR